MPRRPNFSAFEQGGIWALHKHAHWPLSRIAEKYDTSKSVISSLLTRLERGPRNPPARRGRPPKIKDTAATAATAAAVPEADTGRLPPETADAPDRPAGADQG